MSFTDTRATQTSPKKPPLTTVMRPVSRQNNNNKRPRSHTDSPNKRPRAPPKPVLDVPPPPQVKETSELPVERVLQVGQGTYGKVYKSVDTETGKVYAMKKLRLPNQNEELPYTAAREIHLLQILRHQNIVKLSEIYVEKNEIFMCFDYVENDLAGLLLNPKLTITPAHIKSIFKQIMHSISYLHSHGIIHRDIKGSNILITSDGVVKLADFGLARKVSLSSNPVKYTNRVVTFWYRPPELLLGSEYYSFEVDIWSLGCLLAEMFMRSVLFEGESEIQQLSAIYSVMGVPTLEEWPERPALPWFNLIETCTRLPAHSQNLKLTARLVKAGATKNCIDMITKMVVMNPKMRISADEALAHRYFAEDPQPESISVTGGQEWHDWEAKRRNRQKRRP